MLNILYVINYYKPAFVYGGPVRSVSTLCEGLVKAGANVTVLTTNANGNQLLDVPLKRSVQLEGVNVHYYPVVNILPKSFFYSPSLASACAELIPHHDLVVADTFFTHAMEICYRACKKHRKPYILPLRGQLLSWALQHRRTKKQLYLFLLGRRYLNGANALLCTDLSEVNDIQKLNVSTPLCLIPNGIDIKQWEQMPARGAFRRQLCIEQDVPIVLFLGRLHRVKRPELALHALAASGIEHANIIFAGPDEENYLENLRLLAVSLNIQDRVHFTGLLNLQQIHQLLADVDLLVMPSEMENFGMSAVEALAASVPVLVSDAVPVGRWAEQAGAGRMVPRTVEAFASAIHDLLNDRKHLQKMGERGRKMVRAQFDISAVAKQMLAQCESLVTTGQLQSNKHIVG